MQPDIKPRDTMAPPTRPASGAERRDAMVKATGRAGRRTLALAAKRDQAQRLQLDAAGSPSAGPAVPATAGEARVFISYARADASIAEDLHSRLIARGIGAWWDRDIVAGENYRQAIDRALAAASAVIVIWSNASTASSYVVDEASDAERTGKLVPMLVSGFAPDDIPKGLRQRQAYPVAEEARLFEALARLGVHGRHP